VIGHVQDRSHFTLDDRWSLHLNRMGITKTGIFRAIPPKNSDGDSFYGQLLQEVPEGYLIPAVAHVSYLGFHFCPLGLLFRNVADKDFKIASRYKTRVAFYVSQRFEENLSQFWYGRPIVLLEGLLDVEAFAYLTDYPFIMGYLTSRVNDATAAFISTLTDKVLLVPDNDSAGRRSVSKSKVSLKAFNVQSTVLSTQAKDFGNVLENPDQDVLAAKAILSCYGQGTQLGGTG